MGYAVRFLSGDIRLLSGPMVLAVSALCVVTSAPAQNATITESIDLYQIHGNDSVPPVEETLRALDTLVQQGKVRYIGCSNWQAWKVAKSLGISEFKNLARFDTLRAYYSIAGRDLERARVRSGCNTKDESIRI